MSADLGEDVIATGDSELDRVPRCDPQCGDGLDVARIGDRDVKRAVDEQVRDRDKALEDVDGNLLQSVLGHARGGEIDERQAMSERERPGRSLARRKTVPDE